MCKNENVGDNVRYMSDNILYFIYTYKNSTFLLKYIDYTLIKILCSL